MRNLYHFLLQALQKLKIEKTIRHYDLTTPVQKKLFDTPLIKEGWQIFSSEEIFGESLGKFIEDHLSSRVISYDTYGNWTSRDLPEGLIEKIATNKSIQDIVTNYLGDGARLDDIYLWFKSGQPSEKSISEGWHDDNVGHRLKFFICLEAGPSSPKTLVFAGSHKKLYNFNFWGEFNRLVTRSENTDNQSHWHNIKEICYQRDQIIAFDTNIKHRGQYADCPGERNCIIVEFINRHKSNRISGLAPCGPGQSKDGYVQIRVKNINFLNGSDLIDPKILKKQTGKVYTYSISNLRNE